MSWDQTRLLCEFGGANPFSGSGDISYTNNNKNTDWRRQKQNLAQLSARGNERVWPGMPWSRPRCMLSDMRSSPGSCGGCSENRWRDTCLVMNWSRFCVLSPIIPSIIMSIPRCGSSYIMCGRRSCCTVNTCMLNHCLEWYQCQVSVNELISDRQRFDTLIAWPLTRWRHIPNDIMHRVKWRHISVVAMQSPFCRSTRRTVCS